MHEKLKNMEVFLEKMDRFREKESQGLLQWRSKGAPGGFGPQVAASAGWKSVNWKSGLKSISKVLTLFYCLLNKYLKVLKFLTIFSFSV